MFDGKVKFVLLTVLIPFTRGEIEETPTIKLVDWTTSAENVFAAPTCPNTDLTSDRPNDVIAVATLPLGIPSIINDSFKIKSPLFSYTDIEDELETEDFKNAVAPLLFPRIKQGTFNVIGWFKVIVVTVCISYNDIPHSLMFGFDELYDPDSSLKSYTLATPISLPEAVVWDVPTLESLRLNI